MSLNRCWLWTLAVVRLASRASLASNHRSPTQGRRGRGPRLVHRAGLVASLVLAFSIGTANGEGSLGNDYDARITGASSGDWSGVDVAVRDLNDDGTQDLIVGARHASPAGRQAAGKAFVTFGPIGSATLTLTMADVVVNGVAENDAAATSVATGDIDGDGVDDLVVGAHHVSSGELSTVGRTYVIYGPFASGTIELTEADMTVSGSDTLDISGAGTEVGDMNDDGAVDPAIHAW